MSSPRPTLRADVPKPPTGWMRLRWLGPGLLWAVSAVGSGSVLFTPRVGSRYGFELIWLLWFVCFLMWVMIRESARFSVVTGRTLLDGMSTLPGPRNWALWVVFVPQLVAAAVGIAGLAALVGSALGAELPGGVELWGVAVIAVSTVVVAGGGYRSVSRVASVMAGILVGVAAFAAASVFSRPREAAAGLVPGAPQALDVPFLLPWVGTILAGSMGIIWFSYWAATRGFGGGAASLSEGEHSGDDASDQDPQEAAFTTEERHRRLRGWMRSMSNTALLGVLVGTIIITAFLVLGVELLGPEGLMPSGADVAIDLTRLLSDVWGRVGYWLMMAAVLVAFGGSVLANQDGWGRSFADITLLLPCRPEEAGGDVQAQVREPRAVRLLTKWRPESMGHRRALKIMYVVVVTGLMPAVLIVLIGDPVSIMSASGGIAAAHTPFIVFVTLFLNRRLPVAARPGWIYTSLMGIAGLFYLAFAGLFVADLMGLLG